MSLARWSHISERCDRLERLTVRHCYAMGAAVDVGGPLRDGRCGDRLRSHVLDPQ